LALQKSVRAEPVEAGADFSLSANELPPTLRQAQGERQLSAVWLGIFGAVECA
jgi:hypothetical protein